MTESMTDTRIAEIREFVESISVITPTQCAHDLIRAKGYLRESLSTIDRLTAENAEKQKLLDEWCSGEDHFQEVTEQLECAKSWNADLLQKTQQLKQQNAKLTERLAAAVEDMRFVFEQKRRYADSEVLDGVDCICPLCACWLGDGAKSCDGDCNNAQWRGEESE